MVDNKLIVKDIRHILAVFKKHNVDIYLSWGALLGAVREKRIIPWDDDIDLDVIDQNISYKTRKEIGHTLLDLGFRTQPYTFNVFGRMEPVADGYDGTEESGIIVCERNFHFTIFFHKKVDDMYKCYPKMGMEGHLIEIPTKFFDKKHKVKLYGEEFISPGPHAEYFTYVYGHDWKTPIQGLNAPNCITGKKKHE